MWAFVRSNSLDHVELVLHIAPDVSSFEATVLVTGAKNNGEGRK